MLTVGIDLPDDVVAEANRVLVARLERRAVA
jgi:hypothetical protein